MGMDVENVGTFITDLRKKQNWTQKELAERLSVTDKAVSRWETGKGIPDISSLENLSRLFEVSINEILAGKCMDREKMEEFTENADWALICLDHQEKRQKKRRLFLAGACGALACLIVVIIMILGIYLTIPFMGTRMVFDCSEAADNRNLEKMFGYVESLEEKGSDYTVSVNAQERVVTILSRTAP